MKNISRFLTISISLFAVFFVFRNWFTARDIIGGDWPYFYSDFFRYTPFFPPSWSSLHGNGLGGQILSYSLDTYLYATGFIGVHLLHIPWYIVSKIFWFWLFLFLSLLSSKILFTTIWKTNNRALSFVSSLIFSTNTYILMVTGGGQLGVALAYALAPLVLAVFIRSIDYYSVKKFEMKRVECKIIALSGLALTVQVLFDPRIAYITMFAVCIYWLVCAISAQNKKYVFFNFPVIFFIPFTITFLFHAFWILPTVVFRENPMRQLGPAFSSLGAVKFFSFAKFENTLGLLHPNWSENIFGKVGFMKPAFLVLPIIAFSSLLLMRAKNKIIIFFALIGLCGIFLAKGANEPFGTVYLWLFTHVPGFQLFRDPLKFYVLIALSYAVLIPLTLHTIAKKATIPFLIFWLFLLFPALTKQLSGTFSPHTVPPEYSNLKHFLEEQNGFFRTLWIPRQQRFTYASYFHPAVEASPLFNAASSAEIVKKLNDYEYQYFITQLGIKYVIVPYDSLGEIFLRDRTYDPRQYRHTIQQLDVNPGFKKIGSFGRIVVYQTQKYNDHFWFIKGEKFSYTMVSPSNYQLKVNNLQDDTLIFSENYSPYWVASIDGRIVNSVAAKYGLNSFRLHGNGRKLIHIYYKKTEWYTYGILITLVTVIGTIFIGISFKKMIKLIHEFSYI